MDTVNRRDAVKLAVAAGAITLAGVGPARAAEEQKKDGGYVFEQGEASKACRLIPRVVDKTKAEAKVVPGIVNGTYFLLVSGKKPYINMKVHLVPRTYIRVPEYWGIEVIGCIPGIALPQIGVYFETLSLENILGTKGIDVIWDGGETERIQIP